ncbi:hypothetical protein COO60DRAFT_1628088 [Scenedesmus sp. NREL 46B-D3]|nr:hypothetical protein COO60DRAFT_1628088 [Scenedesmus sp. NREL 46B-D3]
MEGENTATVLPLDVVQIVLGYLTDSRSVAAARQACKSWRQTAAAAPCAIRVVLPSGAANMRHKLAMLLKLLPGLSGVNAGVTAGSDSAYTSACLQDLLAFQNLRQLELSFADSQELGAADIAQLASLTGLSALRLCNVSLSAAADSSPLTALQGLQDLSLVHHSKVSALMVGDGHLQVLGRLAGLQSLVLQGRMCSATDEGLLALTGLVSLSSLSISWVPWQSQITQPAALQLLAALSQLKSLQLGGAELLLPSTPYHPVSGAAAPTPAVAPPHHGPMHQPGLMGQQQGLIAAAVAAVAGGVRAEAPAPAGTPGSSTGGGAAAAAAGPGAGHPQGEHMRSVLAAKGGDLREFKLQFNCCGTGVEKALVSLGEVRRRLTGLQWSYAKLSGPSSVTLLASCTNLASLKLRLWYQDYNLTPFDFNLLDLSQLRQLRTLVIDKRPPFQQQLPAQQAAISMPVTSGMLSKLACCWPHLEKLQLGLARGDFGHAGPLEGLTGFSQLRSLSVHCYDQGYDDGHFMLPINVATLPSSLAPPGLPLLQHLQLKHCALDGIGLEDVISAPAELRSLQLVEVVGLCPRDIALMPCLASLLRLTLIAAKEDAWLGLAPLRLLSKLPELRHLDWVVSERTLPARSKAMDLQALLQFAKLQVITLHTVLGKCEQLHAVSGQLQGGCHVRLMAPAYCEHASRRSGSKISRLLGAASCLIPGTGC